MDNALILIAEDEPEITDIVTSYLERANFRTVRAGDGVVANVLFHQLKPDLVLLDIKMPKRDGNEVLSDIRRVSDTPVIMLTALDDDLDKVSALRMGADDYVLKPFNPQEVVERVKAVLRRSQSTSGHSRSVNVGALEIDINAHAIFSKASNARVAISFTHTEFLLIQHMSASPQRAYSRSELVDACLPEGDALERTIDSHVSNARRKLQDAGISGFLQTVRNVGYRLEPIK